MIGGQPKLKNPETDKVDADYRYDDIKTQRQYLLNFANAINSQREEHEPKIDGQAIVKKGMNRIARYYNMQTRFNGDGSLKEGF